MTRSGERDLSRIGGMDYALMTAGSCLAAFSGGMALQQSNVGIFAVLGIVIGASVSYSVRVALLRSKFIKLDGWLYAMAVIAGVAFAPQLQQLMPDGGYGQDVMAAGWLTCMLILGSFFTWQDATILFQAVPAISLFALAGIYSTWTGVDFAFFGFLICLATLVARAHRRAMLLQAAESGYFTRGLAPGSVAPSVETTPGLAQRMQDGPWKWIAGPEWALLSALAVVLISLAGAPVIRIAIQPVSGFAKVGIPRSVQKAIAAKNLTVDTSDSVTVGQGPTHLEATPEFEIRTDPKFSDAIQYVRTVTYYSFSNHAWSVLKPSAESLSLPSGAATSQSILAILQPVEFPFDVRLRASLKYLPYPGFVARWNGSPPISRVLYDGRIQPGPGAVDQAMSGYADMAPPGAPSTAGNDQLPAMFDEARTPGPMSPRVLDLVQKVTAGAKTDFERAERIRAKIAATVTYNINAPAIDSNADPVEDVMFNHPQAYCVMYATAMTLMARAANIPARYVEGYRPSPANVSADGWVVGLQSDRHAWSELFFKDYGWVIFDATEGAASVPDAGPGATNNAGPLLSQPWVATVIDCLIGLGVATFFAIGLRTYLFRRKAPTPRAELDRAYVSFTTLLERRLRSRRNLSATPDEFLEGARPQLGSAYPLAADLNARFVSMFYSPKTATEADVLDIRQRLRELTRLLKAEKQT